MNEGQEAEVLITRTTWRNNPVRTKKEDFSTREEIQFSSSCAFGGYFRRGLEGIDRYELEAR